MVSGRVVAMVTHSSLVGLGHPHVAVVSGGVRSPTLRWWGWVTHLSLLSLEGPGHPLRRFRRGWGRVARSSQSSLMGPGHPHVALVTGGAGSPTRRCRRWWGRVVHSPLVGLCHPHVAGGQRHPLVAILTGGAGSAGSPTRRSRHWWG